MNKANKTRLAAISDRYFRPVIAHKDGIVTHHGDCKIYQAKEIYGFAPCTCGLLHDLRWLDWELAEKVYPKFGEQLVKSEMTWEQEKEAEKNGPMSDEEMLELFKKAGFNINDEPPDFEELKREENEQWAIISEVFGQDYVEYLKQTPDMNI